MRVRVEIGGAPERDETIDVDPETPVSDIMARFGCSACDGWAGTGSRGELFGIVATDPIRFYARDGQAVYLMRGTWVRGPRGLVGWVIGAVPPGEVPLFAPAAAPDATPEDAPRACSAMSPGGVHFCDRPKGHDGNHSKWTGDAHANWAPAPRQPSDPGEPARYPRPAGCPECDHLFHGAVPCGATDREGERFCDCQSSSRAVPPRDLSERANDDACSCRWSSVSPAGWIICGYCLARRAADTNGGTDR